MKGALTRKIFKIFGIWLFVLVLLYVLLEITFGYYFTRLFPLSSFSHAGMGGAIFFQYSKENILPDHYIALLGDSYAFGQGDWLLQGEHAIRPTYSPAHILHEKLKRDVITFGFPASDSIRANNILPEVFFIASQKSRSKEIEDPESIIVYFYEGNDLNDNIEVAEHLIYPLLEDKHSIYDEKKFQEMVIPSLIRNNELITEVEQFSWQKGLFFFQFTKNIILDTYHRYRSGKVRADWKPPKKSLVTRVSVGGVEDYLPDRIQSPSLSLDSEQIRLGLYIFEQSLTYLQKKFPHAHIGVAYIPAVITPYEVVSPQIHDYYKDARLAQQRTQASDKIRINSDFICQEVRKITLKKKLGFVDSRSRLRSVAKHSYIHGPIDWNHFNRLGYETFSVDLIALIQQLEASPVPDVPVCQWEI